MSDTPDPKSFPPQTAGDVTGPTPAPQPQQQPPQAPPAPRPGYAVAPPKQPAGFGQGFGKGIGLALGLGVVAIAGLVVSMVIGAIWLGSLVATTPTGPASTTVETVWGSPAASSTLRAIPINGTILADSSDGSVLAGGTYGYEVASTLDGLSAEDSAGVVLLVNTPGGSVTGSKAMADAVTRYRERTGQPVLVHVTSMSASGGVYATATASEIIADHGALVGSIGIISGPFQRFENVTAIGSTLLSAGVEAESITQEYLSMGEGKDFGDPFRDMTDEERARWMDMLEFEYDRFVEHVATNRDIDEATIRDTMGAGIFANDQAQAHGLIDDVMGRDEFFRHAAESAGLDPEDTAVEMVVMPTDFISLLLGVERPFGQSPAAAQGEGITPTLSPAICGPTSILAHHGPLTAACG